MSAVPVHAAGRTSPDPARTTGVVAGAVALDPAAEADGTGDLEGPDSVDEGSALAEPEPPADGSADSDEPLDEDGLCPVIWIRPTTTSTDAINATTMIPITQRVLVEGRAAAIPPVCASPMDDRTVRRANATFVTQPSRRRPDGSVKASSAGSPGPGGSVPLGSPPGPMDGRGRMSP